MNLYIQQPTPQWVVSLMQKIPQLAYDPETKTFVLMERYCYNFHWVKKHKKSVTLPRGMVTDFASIPWFGRWLISPVDKSIVISALVHDYLVGFSNSYILLERDDGTSEEYHPGWVESLKIMIRIMEEQKSAKWKRIVVYTALRLYGIAKKKD